VGNHGEKAGDIDNRRRGKVGIVSNFNEKRKQALLVKKLNELGDGLRKKTADLYRGMIPSPIHKWEKGRRST